MESNKCESSVINCVLVKTTYKLSSFPPKNIFFGVFEYQYQTAIKDTYTFNIATAVFKLKALSPRQCQYNYGKNYRYG